MVGRVSVLDREVARGMNPRMTRHHRQTRIGELQIDVMSFECVFLFTICCSGGSTRWDLICQLEGSNRRMGSPRRRGRAADQQLLIIRAPAARPRCPAELLTVLVGALLGALSLLLVLLHESHQP